MRYARATSRFMAAAFAAILALGSAAVPAVAQQQPNASSPSVSLAPAVLVIHSKFGQAVTETVTMTNGTAHVLNFDMDAQDVIVKNGKRVFVPAGQLPNSIAASAVFSRRSGTVQPGSEESVQVILTVPAATSIRACIVSFHSKHVAMARNAVSLSASLGSLMTFVLTDAIVVEPGAVRVRAATASANLKVVESLKNTGAEPVVPTGVVAFVDAGGALAAKIPFDAQRLLPGEDLEFSATYAGRLKPGLYRVLCSFEFEGKTLTTTGEFRSP
jgi:hypothetical protein